MRITSTLWNALAGIGPAALLLIFAAGNTAPMCGEIEPLDPICEAASECEGLPHIMCEGEWSCESNLCQWDCNTDPDPDPDPDPEGVCTNNLECDEGEHCSVFDGDCLPAPDCDEEEMGCPLVCYGVCVEDVKPDPVCYGDGDCAENEECVIDGCESQCDEFAPCLAECMPVGHCQEKSEPEGCLDDSDCDEGFVCEWGLACAGIWEECDGDDCDMLPCDVAEGVCVPDVPEGCFDDSDCPSGFYCEFGWCGTGPGECLPIAPPPECYSDSDCPNGYECAMTVTCFDCAEDDWCEPGCFEEGGVCVPEGPAPECYDDSDCPFGHICQVHCTAGDCWGEDCWEEVCYGTCVEGPSPDPECMDDWECPSGFVCELTEVCAIDSNCVGGEPGENCGMGCALYGLCQPKDYPYPANECSYDSQCAAGYVCLSGLCAPDGSGGECFGHEDCGEWQYCWKLWSQAGMGLCVDKYIAPPPECDSDADCPAGHSCEILEECPDCPWDMDCGACYVTGVCMPDPGCPELPCPPGFEFDPETCECANLPGTCMISGCSAEICAPQPMDSYCVWEPWFECYSDQITTCGPYGPEGECMWEPTPEFFACMSKHF